MEPSELVGGRIAIYARYSSDKQSDASIEDQVHRCKLYIEGRGGSLDEKLVFTDRAVSGASLERGGFDALMRLVRKGSIDAIVVEDLSRVSRDMVDSMHLFRELRFRGIPLLSVADGLDTSARGSKMAFAVKSLIADLYLDDLRDKTRRGLEGRHRSGFSTGGLPYGYLSEPETDARGSVVGHRIQIREEQAAIVRRVFRLYLAGLSLARIARKLNDEGVLPPRSGVRKGKGWADSSVRNLLHQPKYVGQWAFNQREWMKVPGTNRRRSRPRPEHEHITVEREDLRIIDDQTWRRAQERLATVARKYRKGGAGKGRTGRARYPLSGLLVCGYCGHSMVITGPKARQRYRCNGNKARGTCDNKQTIKETVVRAGLFRRLEKRFKRPAAVRYLRRTLESRLRQRYETAPFEIERCREELSKTQSRIDQLVAFISEGRRSDAVIDGLKEAEALAARQKHRLVELEKSMARVEIPPVDEIVDRFLQLEMWSRTQPAYAGEILGRLFGDGHIQMHPQADGAYLLKSTFYPLRILQMPTAPPVGETPVYSDGCGGRI